MCASLLTAFEEKLANQRKKEPTIFDEEADLSGDDLEGDEDEEALDAMGKL